MNARPSLKAPKSKLYRASQKLKVLEGEIARYSQNNPYRIVLDEKTEPGWKLHRFYFRRPIPVHWTHEIGEIATALRSALNYLVNQLIMLNGQIPLVRSEFPIFESCLAFFEPDNRSGRPSGRSGPGKMKGISLGAMTFIESLQPYHRRDDPHLSPLWTIHDLSNIDKHRDWIIVGSGFVGGTTGIGGPGTWAAVDDLQFTPVTRVCPLEDGAVIHRFAISFKGVMSMHFEFTLDITFAEGSPGFCRPVVTTLEEAVFAIGSILEYFNPGSSPWNRDRPT